jgi:superfamily II DNA or RNA helicase
VSGRPLRPYQEQAVEGILEDWTRVRSTLLVLATGLGKTRVATETVLRRRSAGRSLFLAHRSELLSQAMEALSRDGGLVCELEQAGVKANVRPGMLGMTSHVVVASVATLHKSRLRRWPENAFSTIIVDEAHHATAVGYRSILEYFPGAKVLGLTATPDRSDKVGLHNVFESCAFQYGIRDGIRDGYLAPIRARKVVVGKLDLKGVKVTAGDYSAADLERVMRVEGVIHQIASPLVERAGDRPTIAFCPTVAVAEELARVLSGYVGADKVACISAQTPAALRKDILDRYKAGSIQFVTNCAVLTEGFDAPSTACIAMCRPTKSRALYTQCVGRGTRLAPGKDHCLLLDFCARNGPPDLVGPADVLAGEGLKDGVREEIERKLTTTLEGADDLDDLIAQATAAAEEADRRAVAERRRARLAVVIPHAVEKLDVFPELAALADTAQKTLKTAPSGHACATEKQVGFLAQYGIQAPPETSKKSAGDLITYVFKRGMPTFKQARTLANLGLRTDVTKKEASSILDAVVLNKWRVPPEVMAQYRAGNT